MYVDKPSPAIERLVSATFPTYRGRKIQIKVNAGPHNVASYWCGGSRDYFCFYRADGVASAQVPAQSAFDAPIQGADSVMLPPGLALVEHSIFCGKDMGITIYLHPADAPKWIEPPPQISRDCQIVLCATGLKNTYGGEKDIRFKRASRETAITRDQYDTAFAECVQRGYLTKQGAITPSGRNALASATGLEYTPDLYHFRVKS